MAKGGFATTNSFAKVKVGLRLGVTKAPYLSLFNFVAVKLSFRLGELLR